MKCIDIIKMLQKLAPDSLACSWDNVGLMVGRTDKNVSKILIALEVNDEVILQAVNHHVDMIITHHPFIFHPLTSVTSSNFIGRRALLLIQHDISCYSMHTNFDKAVMGKIAADRLYLREQRFLDEITEYKDEEGQNHQAGIGVIGQLKHPLTVEALCDAITEQFDHAGIKVFVPEEKLEETVQALAVVPGAGGDYVTAAAEAGAEVLITGDVSHHQGVDAVSQNMIVLDVGHYSLEYPFVEYVEQYLMKQVSSDVEIETASYQSPYHIYNCSDPGKRS